MSLINDEFRGNSFFWLSVKITAAKEPRGEGRRSDSRTLSGICAAFSSSSDGKRFGWFVHQFVHILDPDTSLQEAFHLLCFCCSNT